MYVRVCTPTLSLGQSKCGLGNSCYDHTHIRPVFKHGGPSMTNPPSHGLFCFFLLLRSVSIHARPYISQLENNLVVLDKTTGHMGHQINCLDETRLLQAMGGTADYNRVGRRPSTQELERLQVPVATELPSWRMTLGQFAKAYPETGQVFINDYKEFPNLLQNPALTIYDKVMQFVFDIFLDYHGKSPRPIFPTVDVSLRKKGCVWRLVGILSMLLYYSAPFLTGCGLCCCTIVIR